MDTQIIALLTNNSLTLFDAYIGKGKSLGFSEEVVKHLEVVNSSKLREMVKDFTADMSTQHALLLLSKDVIFQKSLPSSEENLDIKAKDFFSKVPFAPEKVARKKIEAGGQVYLFSTNAEFYKLIVEILIEVGWKISHVVPIGVFPRLQDKNTLSPEEVGEVLESTDVLDQSNFIDGEEFVIDKVDVQDVVSFGTNWKKFFLIGFMLIIIVGAVGAGAYWYRMQAPRATIPTVTSDIKESSPSATPFPAIEKSKLKIQILNGSGVVGQAGKIKDDLLKLGFSNIDTGNSEIAKRAETIASFSANVANQDKSDIQKVLEEIFAKVDLLEAGPSAKDVQITTGSGLK